MRFFSVRVAVSKMARSAPRSEETRPAFRRSELESISSDDVCGERLHDLLCSNVNNGDGSILRVGCPELFAVLGDVEAFGAASYRDYGFIQSGC